MGKINFVKDPLGNKFYPVTVGDAIAVDGMTLTNKLKQLDGDWVECEDTTETAIDADTTIRDNMLLKTEQGLTDSEKSTVRTNISAASRAEFIELNNTISELSNQLDNARLALALLQNSVNDILPSSNTVNSVANLGIDIPFIVANLEEDNTFSLNGVPSAGKEIHVIVKNTGSNSISVTIPKTSPYVSCLDDDSISIDSGSFGEINAISDGTNIYLRAIGN